MYEVLCRDRFDKLEKQSAENHDLLKSQSKDMESLMKSKAWLLTTLSGIAIGVCGRLVFIWLDYMNRMQEHLRK